MAATFAWKESNTVSETVTTMTNCNLGSADVPNLNVDAHPVVRGTNSFEKYIRGLFTGTWTVISNVKFWKSVGTLLTGETIKAAGNVSFVTPTETANGDSDIPTSVGTAIALNSAEGNATIVHGATGVSGYTGYVRLQKQTTGSTPTGNVNQKTLKMQYDEV